MLLSIDQSSNLVGVSLWTLKGSIVAHTSLKSHSSKDTFAKRLQGLVIDLELWLKTQPKVTQIVFEATRPKLVLVTVGAYLCAPSLDVKLHETVSFVSPSSWKKWAQRNGATGPFSLIKGVKALTETGFDVVGQNVTSDDTADSIMQALSWFERYR